jgi:hypothetical protein
MESKISKREEVEEILKGLGERRPRPGFLLPSQELHYDMLS